MGNDCAIAPAVSCVRRFSDIAYRVDRKILKR